MQSFGEPRTPQQKKIEADLMREATNLFLSGNDKKARELINKAEKNGLVRYI